MDAAPNDRNYRLFGVGLCPMDNDGLGRTIFSAIRSAHVQADEQTPSKEGDLGSGEEPEEPKQAVAEPEEEDLETGPPTTAKSEAAEEDVGEGRSEEPEDSICIAEAEKEEEAEKKKVISIRRALITRGALMRRDRTRGAESGCHKRRAIASREREISRR
uniref:Retrotransposon protein, putative, unclassified n=1 Tax=Steinernema glaseri TaxID=37863 RepID=A0A1I7YW81_9BILA